MIIIIIIIIIIKIIKTIIFMKFLISKLLYDMRNITQILRCIDGVAIGQP